MNPLLGNLKLEIFCFKIVLVTFFSCERLEVAVKECGCRCVCLYLSMCVCFAFPCAAHS